MYDDPKNDEIVSITVGDFNNLLRKLSTIKELIQILKRTIEDMDKVLK